MKTAAAAAAADGELKAEDHPKLLGLHTRPQSMSTSGDQGLNEHQKKLENKSKKGPIIIEQTLT